MTRFVLRRLLLIPPALFAANILGFAYALAAQRIHANHNPFFASREEPPPILGSYLEYLRGIARLDFGTMPTLAANPVLEAVWEASLASLGLLAITFTLSLAVGLLIGLSALRTHPARLSRWLVPAATLGVATPSFYVGTLAIVGGVLYTIERGEAPPIPFEGFGWDLHLVLPVLSLSLRPTLQIAQVTASLLVGELGKQYIVAARSKGNAWGRLRWIHALRNVLAPVALSVAGSFRSLVVELVIVERLFYWPGLGYLLATALIPAALTSQTEAPVFLNPPVLALLLTVFALLFVVADLAASVFVRVMDPRLRLPDGDTTTG